MKQKNSVEPDMTLLSSDGPEKGLYVLVAVGSSGILKGKQKLCVTFNSDKLGSIDLKKIQN